MEKAYLQCLLHIINDEMRARKHISDEEYQKIQEQIKTLELE